jgi:hypothetical protein
MSVGPDADEDGIPDAYEDRAIELDTDRDGTPDYLDVDSDDDGVLDAIEGQRPGEEPLDSDGDGTPDFRDLDSDDNGVPDASEGGEDLDGDGRPNSGDNDDDGDELVDSLELDGQLSPPRDLDGDGRFDFQDPDTDGDWVADREESNADTDRDGTLDRLDLDSDDDGVSDLDEAGDRDLDSRAADTDGDGVADFRDADSDADGISDRLEQGYGTDRIDGDSDDDGASDLIEIGAGTDPLDATDHPRARGDFVFVMPPEMPSTPTSDVLAFATDLRRGDVYFLMDTTGSMDEEIATLRADLETVILPAIREQLPEAWVGLGRYDDFPTEGYGGRGDVPYAHLLSMTDDESAMVAAVATLGTNYGDDRPESAGAAMFAAITGGQLDWPEPPAGDAQHDPHPVPAMPASCDDGRFGHPCFRPDAVPVFVNITDAPLHGGPGGSSPYSFDAPSYTDLISALDARSARVLWIDSGDALSRGDGARLTSDTGAVDGAGAGLVYEIERNGTGLTDAIVEGIRAVSGIAFEVSLMWRDDPSDAVETRGAFVRSVTAVIDGDRDRGCTADVTLDLDEDGTPDAFDGVGPGERVCFEIVTRVNTTVAATLEPQVFLATLVVLGDGFTPLSERRVFFLVPPRIPDPGTPF